MKRIVITAGLVVAAALATAPVASAKGYVRAVQVCGPSACAKVHGAQRSIQRLGMDILAGTGRDAPSPALLPYYRLRFQPRFEVPSADTFYIPEAKVICTDSGCIQARSGLAPALQAAAASVGSFTPRISSVTVNDHARTDRAGFAILYDQRPAQLPSTSVWKSRHSSVIVTFSATTPWSLGGASWMVYYPRYHALSRGGRWFQAGADVGRLVRGPARAAAGDGHAWRTAAAVVAVLAAAAVVVLAAAAGAGRRLWRPRSG
jgi:hypothetical protein